METLLTPKTRAFAFYDALLAAPMNAAWQLGSFVGAWVGKGPKLMRECFIDLTLTSGTKRVRCTEPRVPPPGPLPVVVFVHGMSLHGERDPRQDAICDAIAAAGFRVLAPRVEEVARLQFGAASVEEIAEILDAVARDSTLSPDGSVAVASVSFSAPMTLIAASRPTLRARVSSALVIGGYCDPERCVDDLMTVAEDDYGRLLSIWNFMRFAGETNTTVDDAFLAMCRDNVAERPEVTRRERLDGLSPRDRARVEQLLGDANARVELVSETWARRPELLRDLDLVPHIPALRFPIAILHGADDKVIDVEHAHTLAGWLRAYGKPHRLCTTRLIDHGTRKSLLHAGLTLVDVLATLRFFFEAAQDQRSSTSTQTS